MIPIQIHPGSDVPIYRQIQRQIAAAIADGRLPPGSRVPSHRELGKAIVVAPLTVKKAYDELEREQLVETRRGQGTFVVARPPGRSVRDAKAALLPLLRELLSAAAAEGVDVERVLGWLRAEAGRTRPNQEDTR